MMNTNQLCDCGHESAYPEIKGDKVLCMSCAMAYDYNQAMRKRNYALFN